MNRSPHVVSSPDNIQQPIPSGINRTNTNLSANEGSNIAPVASFSDDLGTNVSQQLRDKFINGEYVELESLLSNLHNDQSRTIVIDNNGNLNLKQKSGKKITDIGTWKDAFLIYTSIYMAAHPSSTQGLLKYMSNVKLGANGCFGLSWLSYDQQFRLKKAKNVYLAWGAVDMELWLLYMTQDQTPATVSISLGTCFTYNNKGGCGRPTCRYLHKCLRCAGPHASLYCTLNKSGQNTQAERGIVEYSDTNTNSGRGDFLKERNFTNHNRFRFRQGKSATSGTGKPPVDGAWTNSH